jgi:hypothetical protein
VRGSSRQAHEPGFTLKQGQQFVNGPGGVRLRCTKCGYEFEGTKKLQGCNCIKTPGCKGRVRALRPSEVDQ